MHLSPVAVPAAAAETQRMRAASPPRADGAWLRILGHTVTAVAALAAGLQGGVWFGEWWVLRTARAPLPGRVVVSAAVAPSPRPPPDAASLLPPLSPATQLSLGPVAVVNRPPPAPRPRRTERPPAPQRTQLPVIAPTRVHVVLSRPVHMGLVDGVLSGPLRSGALTVLPAGATLRGAAAQLDSGRFVVRFDEVEFRNGATAAIEGTGWVEPGAATERPELDLWLHTPEAR